MKKLLFILFAFCFSFSNVAYASFPIVEKESSKTELSLAESTNSLSSAVSSNGKGMSIAALVCGIVGLFVGGLILGPLAIIFGAIGMKRGGRGMAIAGLICGIVATVGALIFLALLV